MEILSFVLLAQVASPVATSAQNLSYVTLQILLKLLWAIGILILTRIGINVASRTARRVLVQVEPTLRKFFIQTAEFLALIVGLVAALNVVGIQTTTLVAVLGAAGLAVGLALQNTLSHFAAGIMLIAFRPFEAGDVIEGAGATGVVDSVGIFSTTILTPDNVKIVVPNNNLFAGTLKNLTAMGTRRVDLEVDIGNRPIEPTITSLLSLVQPHPLVLNDPKPTCNVASVNPEKTILYLRPWCAAEVYEQARSEMHQLVHEALYQPRTSEDEGGH
ncbi:mechanosensitive ion channel family protein [Phormidium sp. FACHB-592]|uniref:Mechanosensitive ion channel family protein n=1 Tax=Stenomitos frigidus AS-A4 TaxID=2933935 RepID=A0ABV0KHA4_9CYAN|nr:MULTISPECIES: mechanosensitive ion channel family protein [Cyanophyceae]MBD2036895.1 mechanosensitive ion channel family protein [Leptolyngbya sp. FACHB-321]MBD2073524.1 mechanosensitive ion channel family protein [Phormidium sp. FACHB-592]